MSGEKFTFGKDEAAVILFEEALKNPKDLARVSTSLSACNRMMREVAEEKLISRDTRLSCILLLRNRFLEVVRIFPWPVVATFYNNVIRTNYKKWLRVINHEAPFDPMSKIRSLTWRKS